MFDIKSKVALVTGGTEGIGLALVERLLSLGARVVIANRNAALAATVLEDLRKRYAGAEVRFVRMDACIESDVHAAFAYALSEFGGVDIAVANSGFDSEEFLNDILADNEKSDDGWKRGLAGNLVSPMLLGRIASSHWLKNDKQGAYVVTSSILGMHGVYPSAGTYGAITYPVSKAAQIQFIEVLQAIVDDKAGGPGKAKQTYNAVLPGLVWTAIWQRDPVYPVSSKEEFAVHPVWAPFHDWCGGWTPMDRLIDSYIAVIAEQEKYRGTAWAVCGEGGEMKEYPRFNFEDFVSRAPKA
ncbi:hypothetical protein DFJ74DRAFT_110566 [Hyaloraphidium curvatum]|nr:hypothetical protein DFJ74DRAFT_110566 [Hyaloraphidium curvatum]